MGELDNRAEAVQYIVGSVPCSQPVMDVPAARTSK